MSEPAAPSKVLIIGSGAAGLTCALKLARHGIASTVVSKAQLESGATLWAQGGISAVFDEDDSLEAHVRDTLVAGAGLCDDAAVRFTIERGPGVVRWLQESGVDFTRESGAADSKLHLTREGGHSYRRVVHAADATGHAVETTLAGLVAANPLITVRERTISLDLILDDNRKRVVGAYLYDRKTKQVDAVPAQCVVLASGGANQVYLYSSNPFGASGDGIAMAWRAGCRVANMEFMQFHPTILYNPGLAAAGGNGGSSSGSAPVQGARSFLISEALRGEGAVLRLPTTGERFMPRFDPREELAPRDVVARAIDHEMKRLGLSHVHLDITHKDASFIEEHFPSIHAHCAALGLDITRQPIPVVPAAHFTCGGVLTDLAGRTDVEGLYAAGETACTGLHGANRLASNSILECLVFGEAVADNIADSLVVAPPMRPLKAWDESRVSHSDEDVVVSHNWLELRTFMWDYVGIVRTTKRLVRALNRITLLQQEIQDFYGNYRVDHHLIELRNLAACADLIVRSALARHESRGLHYTLDYPQTLPQAVPTILPGRVPGIGIR
jgi:L-aspartate oxidase